MGCAPRTRSSSTSSAPRGDLIQDRPLAEVGGKGLFTKEIEEALLAGAIDLAVHSAKDMPTVLPAGLVLAACLPREDARDVFISRKAKLARRSAAGRDASAPRRCAGRRWCKRLRPDLAVVPLRGNVETRLRKLDDGEVDATLLALAGLKRLGLADARDRDPRRRRVPAGGRAGRHRHRGARRRRARRASCSRAIDHADTLDRARLPSAPSSPCSTARAARRSPATPTLSGGRAAVSAA